MIDRTEVPDSSASRFLSCAACPTAKAAGWSVLGGSGLERLQCLKSTLVYKPGQCVYEAGKSCSALYCVQSGTILAERTASDGSVRRVDLIEAGGILGWSDFFQSGTHQTRAVCKTPAVICAIPATLVHQLVATHALLGVRLLHYAVRDIERLEARALEFSHSSARQRLARTLAQLAPQHGENLPEGGLELDLPVNRRDLADLVAVRPETLSRAIRELEADGIADFSGRIVRVRDPERLWREFDALDAPGGAPGGAPH